MPKIFAEKVFKVFTQRISFLHHALPVVPSDWRLQQHGHDMTDGAAIFSVVVPPDLCRDVRVGYPTGKAFTKQLK